MTFTEAAAEVLRLVGKPLHYKDITEIAIQKNLLSHVGKSPDVTMGSRLAALLKKSPKENPLVRVKPGVFALRAWEESGPPGPAPDAGNIAVPTVSHEGEPEPEPAEETERAEGPRTAASFATPVEEEERPEPTAEEKMRAEIAAGAMEIFGEEEDDDQPILGGETAADAAGGRRRRRRRRRGGDRPEAMEGLPS